MVHDSLMNKSMPEPDLYEYHTTGKYAPFLIYRLKPGFQPGAVQHKP
jgi:hypothetical protein